MARFRLRSSHFIFFARFLTTVIFLFAGGFSVSGQTPAQTTAPSSSSENGGVIKDTNSPHDGDRSYSRDDRRRDDLPGNDLHRDDLRGNWNQRGRTVPGDSAARLRFRAYQQKMAMRAARRNSVPTASLPASQSGSTVWTSVGPAPLASDATGEGGQNYNWVSGRATSVLIDPADGSGNTVILGGAYGGLWKSTNAGSLNSNPAAVTWQALIDDQPTLAVGAIALQPGNSNVILVGTGETNSSGDSYYGLGILRSTDGGLTWPMQIQSAGTGQSFLGIGFSKIAFSTANPLLAVAATAGQRALPWPGRRQQFDRARTLLFRGRGHDLEPRHPLRRRGSGIGDGSDLQPQPGSERDFLRVHPAAWTLFIARRPAFYAPDYAAYRWSGLCELPRRFEFEWLSDLSRRVCGSSGTQRDVCVGGRSAARRIWKSRTGRRGHLADEDGRSELDTDSG